MTAKKHFLIFERISPWIITIIIFFVPFSWFGESVSVIGDEIYFLLNPGHTFLRNFYTWDPAFGFGVPNIHILDLPYTLVNLILSLLLPDSLIQKVFFGFSFSMSFYAFYLFLTTAFRDEYNKRWFSILAALFYTFNPYTLAMFPWFSTYSFLFVFAPLLMREISLYLNGRRNLIFFFIYSFLSSSVSSNIALFGILVFFLLTFIMIELLSGVGNIKKVFAVLSIFIIANMHWVAPFSRMYQPLFSGAAVYDSVFSDVPLFERPMLDGFTLQEYYFFDLKDAQGEYYYGYSTYYTGLSRVVILCILIFIVYNLFQKGFFWKRDDGVKNQYLPIYFLFMLLIGVFLSKGTAPPLGDIYGFFLKNIRAFQIYRASDLKFPYFVMFSVGTLLNYALITYRHFDFSLRNKFVYSILLVIICVLLPLPYVRGELFRRSNMVAIPDYWFDYASYVESIDVGRVLLYPVSDSVFEEYSWGYRGGWFTNSISDVSTISNTRQYGPSIQESNFKSVSELFNSLNSLKKEEYDPDLKDLAAKFNITHILYREDLINYKGRTLRVSDLDKHLSKVSFGDLHLYLLNAEPKKFQVPGSKSLVLDKVSPVLYRLRFELPASVTKVDLNFLDSFDENWVLTSGRQKVETAHVIIYSYANSWSLSITDLCTKHPASCTYKGDLVEITINAEYYPQRYFVFFLLVDAVVLLYFLLYSIAPVVFSRKFRERGKTHGQ